jgi:hypothetical protein
VPQELLAIIRQYGGNMKETYGVPVEEIQEAIKHGVRKINIDTDIRLAMTGAVRKFMAENPEKFDMREWMKPAARGRQADLQAALHRVRLRRPGRQDQGRERCRPWRPVRQGRAGADGQLRPAALAIIDGPPHGGPFSFQSLPYDRRPPHLQHHLAAAACARQGARQLRGRQRPHPDGGERPASAFDVIMGEPIPGKGEILTKMALFWFARLGHVCPNHLTARRRKRGDAGRSGAGEGPLDAGEALKPIMGGSGGCAATCGQRLEGIPGEPVVCGVAPAAGPEEREQAAAADLHAAAKAGLGHDENVSY